MLTGLALFTHAMAADAAVRPPSSIVVNTGVTHRYFGVLQAARGTTLTLRLRNGRALIVDASAAFAAAHVAAPLFAGKATIVEGRFAPNGVFDATLVKRALPNPASWDIDR